MRLIDLNLVRYPNIFSYSLCGPLQDQIDYHKFVFEYRVH